MQVSNSNNSDGFKIFFYTRTYDIICAKILTINIRCKICNNNVFKIKNKIYY